MLQKDKQADTSHVHSKPMTAKSDQTQQLQAAYDVIVIGAGMAGTSTVSHLVKGGFRGSICLLEARDTIGGRTRHTHFGTSDGLKVEYGANWIHGLKGNPLYELARECGAISDSNLVACQPIRAGRKSLRECAAHAVPGVGPFPYNMACFTEDGRHLSDELFQETSKKFFEMLEICAEITKCGPGESVGAKLEQLVRDYLSQADLTDKDLRRRIISDLISCETCFTGCDSLSEVSLACYGSYEEVADGNVIIPAGYSTLLDHLLSEAAKHHKKTLHVAKNKAVTRIEQISPADGQNRVVLSCADGARLEAAHCVVTVPLGVLKASVIHFVPNLPDDKIQAIRRLGFGVVDKIFLQFPSTDQQSDRAAGREPAWWPKGIDEIYICWDQTESREWYRKIFSFTHLGSNVVTGWVSGQEAETMEGMSESAVGTQCAEILRKLLSHSEIPAPERVLVTRWRSDSLTRGSYSFPAVGSSLDDNRALARPILDSNKKPLILFAGEATHPAYYSTVHGAYLSGRTAASHLLSN